jgi:hypothetical protein
MRLARQAAIESSLAHYIPLDCDHYTTREAFDTYLHYKPKKGTAFCEVCFKWVKIKKPPMRPPLPEEPMF